MKAVVIVGIIMLALIICLAMMLRHEKRRLANPKMEDLARDAAHLFCDMGVPMTMSQMDEVDLLTRTTRDRIDSWLIRYKKEINK